MSHLCLASSEYQWAIDTLQDKHKRVGRAFLWIPPECEYVRGILWAQQVILEDRVVNDPLIRKVCTRQDLAIIHITPMRIGYDTFGPDGDGPKHFEHIVDNLTAKSGYEELKNAPFLTIGHSGGALPAWRMGYWNPERCFGVISLRAYPIGPPKHAPEAQLNGIPTLTISGQFETWDLQKGAQHHWRECQALIQSWRLKWDNFLGSVIVHPGAGHFNWDDKISSYVSMFIEKAAANRIPIERPAKGEAPELYEFKKENGWLTDSTLTTPSYHQTATYNEFQGNKDLAFWHLDEELARANEAFGQTHGKKLQLVTILDKNGKAMPNEWMQSIELEPLEDGITYRVKASFVEEAPALFSFPKKPYKLSHAYGPIQYRLLGGWGGGGEQVGPDLFRIQFNRVTVATKKPGLMFVAYHPGNEEYLYAEQPCTIIFPKQNKKGKAQTILFENIPDQEVDFKPIELKASSEIGLPVRFAVIEGPVVLEENKLIFTQIPPRTKFPIQVTVAAYQWGRNTKPLVKTAAVVERSFWIYK